MRNFTGAHRQMVTRGFAAVAVLASVGVLAGCGSSGGSGGGGGTTAAKTGTATSTQAQTTSTQAQTTSAHTGTSKAKSGGGSGASTATASLAAGKKQFTTTCASCHTLAAAGTHGTVGPNLDKLKPSKALVTHQVTHGGGGMPAFGGQLSKSQIASVATYVSKVAGKG